MFSRTKSVVGLDIGTSAVKAIELTQRGRDIEVTAFGQIEAPSDDPHARSQAVRDLLYEGGFKTRRLVTSVAGKMVIIRYLSMVRMSDEELRNAISFEAEKYVPFPLEECVLDCQRIDGVDDTRGSGNMTVLMVAVKRSQIDDHLKMVGDAGFNPEIVDVDAFALANAYDLCASTSRDLDTEGTLAFVDVGASKTNINIVHSGTSLFTREIALGGQDFTGAISKRMGLDFDDAENLKREPGDGAETVRESIFPTIDDLGNELQLSFDYFENQFEKEISRIYLSGGGSRLSFFHEAFERIFEKPTATFNPFEYIHVNDAIDFDLLSCNAPQLVVAMGLAARMKKA